MIRYFGIVRMQLRYAVHTLSRIFVIMFFEKAKITRISHRYFRDWLLSAGVSRTHDGKRIFIEMSLGPYVVYVEMEPR